MESNSPSLDRAEKWGIAVTIILVGMGAAVFLMVNFPTEGIISVLVLFLFWLLYFSGFLNFFLLRIKVKPVSPVFGPEREVIENIAAQYDASFKGIWALEGNNPPAKLFISGVLPGRYDLFVDLNWFDHLSRFEQKAVIRYNIDRYIQRKHVFKHYSLTFTLFTLYLVYYILAVERPIPAELWFRYAPEVLFILGLVLIAVHYRREIYKIDLNTADETSYDAMIELILLDSEESKSPSLITRAIGLLVPPAEKRIQKLEARKPGSE